MDDDRVTISLTLSRRLLDRTDDVAAFYEKSRSVVIREALRATYASCLAVDPEFSEWVTDEESVAPGESETDESGSDGEDEDEEDDPDEVDPNERAAEEGL